MAISIYQLKPRFQALLRPLVKFLFNIGITANAVTISACVISVAVGLIVWCNRSEPIYFALIPIWMFLRMAFNAIDGMLAREFGQQSRLGAFLNELTDVVSDTALYLPFAWVSGFLVWPILLICFFAILTEFVGVVAQALGGTRRYDGPMGKSDRALVFGILGTLVAMSVSLLYVGIWISIAVNILLILTAINRVRQALKETDTSA